MKDDTTTRFCAIVIALVLVLGALLIGINEWNVTHGYAQLIASMWTFCGLVLGTALLAPIVTLLCETLKTRKQTEMAVMADNNKRDNQATLEVERIRQRVEQSHKDGFDGKAG